MVDHSAGMLHLLEGGLAVLSLLPEMLLRNPRGAALLCVQVSVLPVLRFQCKLPVFIFGMFAIFVLNRICGVHSVVMCLFVDVLSRISAKCFGLVRRLVACTCHIGMSCRNHLSSL